MSARAEDERNRESVEGAQGAPQREAIQRRRYAILRVLHHIILSHHGRQEFGALKIPATPEGRPEVRTVEYLGGPVSSIAVAKSAPFIDALALALATNAAASRISVLITLRIAPLFRMWRTSARVSTPVRPMMFSPAR